MMNIGKTERLRVEVEEHDNKLLSFAVYAHKINNLDEIERSFAVYSQVFPVLKKEFNRYLNLLKRINNKEYRIEIQSVMQINPAMRYKQIHTSDFSIADIKWDIDKAFEIIKNEKLEPIQFEISKIRTDLSEVDERRIGYIKNSENKITEPVILAKNASENIVFALDGKHRLHIAKKSGQQFVSAYLFSEESSLRCMVNDDFRILYKICMNINVFNRRLKNEISEFRYSEYANGKTWYPLWNGLLDYFIGKINLAKFNSQTKGAHFKT